MSTLPLALVLSAVTLAGAPASPTKVTGLPLPPAPVRLVIPDVPAFDAALTGRFRDALTGRFADGDRFVAAWRQTQVGGKLEAQWSRFTDDLSWTWSDVLSLKTRAIGLSLLEAGHLEVVIAIDGPFATLPAALPDGEVKTHAGAAYHLVTKGTADGSDDPDRRMGLAWATTGGLLLLATSERALKLALDEALAGRAFAPPLTGLVSVELDLEALRQDRYFRRELLFGPTPDTGRIRAALRLEGERLVEVREGTAPAAPSASLFDVPETVASAWEPDSAGLFGALRGGLLEPIPNPEPRPGVTLAPLPAAVAAGPTDRYLVSLERPAPVAGAPAGDEAELPAWRTLLAQQKGAGWGYAVGRDDVRRLVFAWPTALDKELLDLCRASVERRAGRVNVATVGGTTELRVGGALPALAVRRTGDFVWVGPSAEALASVPTPRGVADVVRWGRLDLGAVRAEKGRWEKAEGPPQEWGLRPLSDRLLGLLAWMPRVTGLSVERKQTGERWTERVVFETGARK